MSSDEHDTSEEVQNKTVNIPLHDPDTGDVTKGSGNLQFNLYRETVDKIDEAADEQFGCERSELLRMLIHNSLNDMDVQGFAQEYGATGDAAVEQGLEQVIIEVLEDGDKSEEELADAVTTTLVQEYMGDVVAKLVDEDVIATEFGRGYYLADNTGDGA